MSVSRLSNKEFGAVFKPPQKGGPSCPNGFEYPVWDDPRTPGSDDSQMEARKIMSHWTPQQVRRFYNFLEYYKKDLTPWKKEWLDRTAPGNNEQQEKIIKCKLALIKRLLIITMTGPQTMEDWCLYYLYHDHQLDIPTNIQNIIRPDWQEVPLNDWLTAKKNYDEEPLYYVRPSGYNLNYPSGALLPGFSRRATYNEYKNPQFFDRSDATNPRLALTNNYLPNHSTNRRQISKNP